MKRLFFLLIASCGTLSAFAQAPSSKSTDGHKRKFTPDSVLSHVVVDINLLGGFLTQDLTTGNTLSNYNNAVSGASNIGTLKFTNGMSYGFDAQLAYFFGKKNHFGIGAGFNYMDQQGDMTLNNFHVEYQSTDIHGNTFRQLITSNGPIDEKLTITNMNIPILLKYKYRFSRRLGFMADAGALINLKITNSYSSNASFDYEAIYRFTGSGENVTAVYDNGNPPATTGDIYYTKAEHTSKNPNQSLTDYFNQTHNVLGYNVGLGIKPNNNSGSVSYATGTVGLLLRPALNYYLSDVVALNLGLYYIYQPFSNSLSSNYKLTDKMGDYNSFLNSATTSNNQSYGLNIGVRIYIGKKNEPLVITSVDALAPSYCGACDGSLVLHGLYPNAVITVGYSMNGAAQPAYNGTTGPDGSLRMPGLCAGTYSNIIATAGKHNAATESVTLTNPPMKITSQNSTNPTANGACDGTITLYGLRAGQNVSVAYQLNGKQMTPFEGVVGQSGAVTLTHLCEGNYTNIVATMGKCTASISDIITLSAPPPPPPPPPVEEVKVTTPILFELNKTIIHPSSYPVLNRAVELLTADKDSYIIVDGYTDITGKPAYNKALSLRRAKAVKAELMRMGISAKRIKIVGHGAKNPAADNGTTEGRMQNRRAVMHLSVGE
jgi:outer membrane protein OmpA-like peptidoglycan-associated protein